MQASYGAVQLGGWSTTREGRVALGEAAMGWAGCECVDDCGD